MLKGLHIVRRAAHRIADAADRAINDFNDGQVQQEPAITEDMLGRIRQEMDGYVDKGVQWRAMSLTDRGRNAQESKHGADFLGVLDISIPGYTVKKGFLAQAKLIEPDAGITRSEFERMVKQCRAMLRRSPDSFVFLYSRSGIVVVPAISVVGLSSPTNPHELYSRRTQSFFELHFECFIGDGRLDNPVIKTIDDLAAAADATGARTALWLQAK